MTDIFDRATENEQRFRDMALTEHKRKARLGSAADWQQLSLTHCAAENCGDPIPEGRRRALPGVRLCVNCQQDHERRGRV